MASLNIYTTTFNCGRTPVDHAFFASNLFNALTTNLPPDLIVLSLQEISPLGNAFLGGSLLAPYFARFVSAIDHAAEQKFGGNDRDEPRYEVLAVRSVGLTGIMVFVRKGEVMERVRWLETAGVGVGVWEMGNKGAVGVRVGLEAEAEGGEDVVLTFVSAHLAPHEAQWESRNADWKAICAGLVFEKDDSLAKVPSTKGHGAENEPLLSSRSTSDDKNQHTLFSPPSHLFFSGDLNYRTADSSPPSGAHESWPQPTDSTEDAHHFSHLLGYDQLSRERRAGKTLHNLDEAEITFPPTYKYSSSAQKYVADALCSGTKLRDDDVWLWAKHRTPSWCDRILFLESSAPKVHAYDALPVQPTSDHRPVVFSCSVSAKAVKADVKQPVAIRRDWREARAAARRLEIAVGLAAYLGWTWEGEALLFGTVVGLAGGYLMLRALIGV